MVKDTFNSVLDNIKERTTNPFLGTLVVVWLFKNWKLVYSLIYFDSKLTLKARLGYIDFYFKDTNFLWNLFYTILITLGILTLTYALLSISRLLTDTYDRIVVPWLSKITDKSSVVLKTVYNSLQEEYRILEKRLDEERTARATIQKERDTLSEEIVKLKQQELMSEVEESGTLEDGLKRLNKFDRIISKLPADKLEITLDRLLSNTPLFNLDINHSEILTMLRREGIIEVMSNNDDGSTEYLLTDIGKLFIEHWNDLNNSDKPANEIDENVNAEN